MERPLPAAGKRTPFRYEDEKFPKRQAAKFAGLDRTAIGANLSTVPETATAGSAAPYAPSRAANIGGGRREPKRTFGREKTPLFEDVDTDLWKTAMGDKLYQAEYEKTISFGARLNSDGTERKSNRILQNVRLDLVTLHDVVAMLTEPFESPTPHQLTLLGSLFQAAGRVQLAEQRVYVLNDLPSDKVKPLEHGNNGFVFGLEYKLDGVTYDCVMKVQTELSVQELDAIRKSLRVAGRMRACPFVPGRTFFKQPSDPEHEDGAAVTLMEKLELDAFDVAGDNSRNEVFQHKPSYDHIRKQLCERKQRFGEFVYDVLVCLERAGATYSDFKLENIGYTDPDFLAIDVESLDRRSFTPGLLPFKLANGTKFEEASNKIDLGSGLPFTIDINGQQFRDSEHMFLWYLTVYAALKSAAEFMSDSAFHTEIEGHFKAADATNVARPGADKLRSYIERANRTFELDGKCERLVEFCDKLGGYLDAVRAQETRADQRAADAVVDLESLATELGLSPLGLP